MDVRIKKCKVEKTLQFFDKWDRKKDKGKYTHKGKILHCEISDERSSPMKNWQITISKFLKFLNLVIIVFLWNLVTIVFLFYFRFYVKGVQLFLTIHKNVHFKNH